MINPSESKHCQLPRKGSRWRYVHGPVSDPAYGEIHGVFFVDTATREVTTLGDERSWHGHVGDFYQQFEPVTDS